MVWTYIACTPPPPPDGCVDRIFVDISDVKFQAGTGGDVVVLYFRHGGAMIIPIYKLKQSRIPMGYAFVEDYRYYYRIVGVEDARNRR